MIELGQLSLDDGLAHIGFAGDTLNTAIYLSRLMPGQVSYVTNLGTDTFSDRMQAVFAAEGIDCSLIGQHPTRLPGIYAIETDPKGERSFRYWREASAARTLFSSVGASLDDLAGFDVIYLSGITLAILPPDIRAALIARLKSLRNMGHQVVFDSNYRPQLWSDAATARATFVAMWAACSLALPSFDDEKRLYPDTAPGQVLDRIGVAEIALKNGSIGPLIRSDSLDLQTKFAAATQVVDTTGAGDSFNAGYIAARLAGQSPHQAAAAGHDLARCVIRHHGAICPRDAMPGLAAYS